MEQAPKRSANHVENPPTEPVPMEQEPKAHRAAPRAALQAGAVGFHGPTWAPSHPHLGGTSPGLAEPLPGHQEEIAPPEPCKGGHSCAPASPSQLCPCQPPLLSHALEPPHVPLLQRGWRCGTQFGMSTGSGASAGQQLQGHAFPRAGLGALRAGCPGPSTGTVGFTAYFGQCLREEAWWGPRGRCR